MKISNETDGTNRFSRSRSIGSTPGISVIPSFFNEKQRFFKMFVDFFEISKFNFSKFFLATNGPECFEKFREACRKNFHPVAPLKTSVVTSYDQKTKKVNDKKSNDYFNVSVFKGIKPGPT